MTVADQQRELNRWTKKYLRGVTPLIVDGKAGVATRRRIKSVKFYLGWGVKRSSRWDSPFVRRLRHPRSIVFGPANQVLTGMRRRRAQRAHWAAMQRPTSGVSRFDGVPVAAWLVPYLEWARGHGWQGSLVSGWRDPAYSEHLCYSRCGAPRCPGTCAGRSSNHSGSEKPRGAVDVSDYYTFARVIANCPLEPRIYNALPADPVHFSASGN